MTSSPSRRTTSAAHLICAYNAENILSAGRGVIDGNGPGVFRPAQGNPAALFYTRMAADIRWLLANAATCWSSAIAEFP